MDFRGLALLTTSAFHSNPHMFIHLLPRGCPVGFEFDQSTNKCEYSHVLNTHSYQPVCRITSDGYNPHITIEIAVKSFSNWIGVLNFTNKTVFGVSNACFTYYNYNSHYDTFIITENIVMLANSDDDYNYAR